MRLLPYGFLRLELSLVEGRGWELAAACGNFGYLFSLEMLSIVILTNVAVQTSVFKRYWAIAAGVLATDCMGGRVPPTVHPDRSSQPFRIKWHQRMSLTELRWLKVNRVPWWLVALGDRASRRCWDIAEVLLEKTRSRRGARH